MWVFCWKRLDWIFPNFSYCIRHRTVNSIGFSSFHSATSNSQYSNPSPWIPSCSPMKYSLSSLLITRQCYFFSSNSSSSYSEPRCIRSYNQTTWSSLRSPRVKPPYLLSSLCSPFHYLGNSLSKMSSNASSHCLSTHSAKKCLKRTP